VIWPESSERAPLLQETRDARFREAPFQLLAAYFELLDPHFERDAARSIVLTWDREALTAP
jgi:hypothetical protein